MRILHYALGFPPYRTGGMTKFCMDLMRQQNNDGNQVALMWPGQMSLLNHKVSVKNRGIIATDKKGSGIHSYEVINPLPVSYDEGIGRLDAFMRDGGLENYTEILKEFMPNIIHIHTLMGLHKSFLVAAKEKEIRIIFTAHDFFPICPKVIMFHQGQICLSRTTCADCGICNTTAMGMKRIRILQSPLYRMLKDSPLIKRLRKKHRNRYLLENTAVHSSSPVGTAADFRRLRDFYHSILNLTDVIHYNSTVTKSVYEKEFILPNSVVIGLSHADVADHRKKKTFSEGLLRIRYLGPQGAAKGFFYLRRHLIYFGQRGNAFA